MNAIKKRRIELGISQAQAADRIGAKYQSDVWYAEKRLEAGHGLRPDKAKIFHDALDIPLDHLLYPSRQVAA